jgi:hypothetical protein
MPQPRGGILKPSHLKKARKLVTASSGLLILLQESCDRHKLLNPSQRLKAATAVPRIARAAAFSGAGRKEAKPWLNEWVRRAYENGRSTEFAIASMETCCKHLG